MKNRKVMTVCTVILATAALGSVSVLADTYNYEGSSSDNTNSVRHDGYATAAQPHVGVTGGYMELPGHNSGGSAGAEVGFKPATNVGLDADFAQSGPGTDTRRTALLGKLSYIIGSAEPTLSHLYIAGSAGLIHDAFDIGRLATVTNNSFAYGPSIGFDAPIAKNWTLGAEAKYLIPTDTGVTDSFAANGAMKYWF